jgi:hypothetical protein
MQVDCASARRGDKMLLRNVLLWTMRQEVRKSILARQQMLGCSVEKVPPGQISNQGQSAHELAQRASNFKA